MKRIFLILIIIVSFDDLNAQFVHKIKADSVLITNDSCTAELNLENSTRNIKGFLYNKGNGRTEFRKVVKLNDSTFIMGGDTLVIGGSPKNLATASLTATGNYSHNWKGFNLSIDSIRLLNLAAKGMNALFHRHMRIQFVGDAGTTGIPMGMISAMRNLANSSDSTLKDILVIGERLNLRSFDVTKGQATLSLEHGPVTVKAVLAASNSSYAKFISVEPDSINILGAISKGTADSIFAVGPYNSFTQANALYKIPISGLNGQNFANNNLSFTGSRTHNAKGFGLTIDSTSFLSLNSAAFSGGAGRYQNTRLTFLPATQVFPVTLSSSLRNAANTADSVISSFVVSARSGQINITSETPGQHRNIVSLTDEGDRFTRGVTIYSATGSVNRSIIVQSDSIKIGGAIPVAASDSIYAAGPYNSGIQTNALYKSPVTSKMLMRDSASNVSQLDIILNPSTIGNWDRIEIQIEKLRPATDNVEWWLRFSNNNGTTFFSAASDYEWISEYKTTVGNGLDNSGADSKIVLVKSVGNASTHSCDGTIKLFHPFDAGVEPKYEASLISNSFNSGKIIKSEAGGRYVGSSMVTAIRILASSGNISKIKYRVIGYKN